jgi:archaellum biogenesis ATPase FlaH
LHAYEDKFKIALFDTEQSPYDFSRSVARIQKFTLYDQPGIFKFFDAFLLREDSSQNILRLIDTYLNQTPELAILIIDGLLDLIESMNDETASKRLITTLKRWGKKHNILIITVLHLGKKDQSSIGHIGSASDRYAQSTLLVEKTKNGTFTCAPKFLRSAKDFNTIEIIYSEQSKNFIQIPNI